MSRNASRRSSLAGDIPVMATPASLKLPSKAKTGSLSPSKQMLLGARTYSKKEAREKLDKESMNQNSKNSRMVSLLNDISQFNSNAINTFNPAIVDLEQRLGNSLETLQRQIEKLRALRESARELTENFEMQFADSQVRFDHELEEIHRWRAPTEKLSEMQERVVQLKEILNASKEKLAKLEEELSMAEEKQRKERQQVKKTTINTQVVLGLLLVIVAYYLFSYLRPN